jgi:hypothetical protein
MNRTVWGSSVFSSEGNVAVHAGDNEAESDNNDRVYSRRLGEILAVLSLSVVIGIVNSRHELEQKMAEKCLCLIWIPILLRTVHSIRPYSSTAQCILLMHQDHSTRPYSRTAQCILLMHQVHSTRPYSSTAQCILLMHQVHSTRPYSSTAQCILQMHQVHSTRPYGSTVHCILQMHPKFIAHVHMAALFSAYC